jgi:iron complex transport system ATP-binding protein
LSAPLAFDNLSAGYGGRFGLAALTMSFVPITGGSVQVDGRDIKASSREALARAIAYLPQGADAHWPVTARTLVALGRLPHRAAFATLSGADRAAIDEALARCDALAFAERRIDELSSGERARVLLARALATQAGILLADEPAAHLDPAHQLRLMELLREEAGRGTAVVVTLHDLALAARFCDRIVVLREGRIAAAGAPHDALSDDVLKEVFEIEAWKDQGADRPIVPWRRI